MILRDTLRRVPGYTAIGAVIFISLMTLLLQRSYGTSHAYDISIPVTTIFYEPAGSQTVVATANVAAAMQGRTCSVSAEAINQSSAHPDNNLIITSPGGSGSLTLADVERAPFVSTTASGQMVFGSTVIVTLDMGPDGIFSAGFSVDLSAVCEDPNVEVCRDGNLITIKESQRKNTDTNPPCPPIVACDSLTVANVDRFTRKFTATASAKNATIVAYNFEFGDGTPVQTVTTGANSAMINHTYTQPGSYNVNATMVFETSPGKGSHVNCPAKVVIIEKDTPVYDLSLAKQVKNRDGAWVDANDQANAPTFMPGDTVDWRIVVNNDLGTTATGVVISDVFPANFLNYVSDNGSGSYNHANLSWNVGTLAGNANRSLVITTTIKALTAMTVVDNWAGITSMNEPDRDSVVTDAIDGNQDDEDLAKIKVVLPSPKLSCLGDRIWIDGNDNGIQDAGEAGLPGVTVHLKNASGTVIGSMVTGTNGLYKFCELQAGDYSIQIELPANYRVAKQNQGNNDSVDSDINANTLMSDVVSLPAGQDNLTVDGGVVPNPPAAVVQCGSLEVLSQTDSSVRVRMNANTTNTTVNGYIFKVNGEVAQETASNEFTFNQTTPGNYLVTGQVVTTDGTSEIGNCKLDVIIEETSALACTGISVVQLSRTEFQITVSGFSAGNATIDSFELSNQGELLGSSTTGVFNLNRDTVGSYTVNGHVVGTLNGESVRLTSEGCVATITVDPEDVEPPVHVCTGLSASQMNRNTFNFTPSFTDGTNPTKYIYTVNGEVKQSGENNSFKFTADKAGTYNVHLTAHVPGENGGTIKVTCSSVVTVVEQPAGAVLSANTPTQLPNTGTASTLTLAALALIVTTLLAHYTAQHLYRRQFLRQQ